MENYRIIFLNMNPRLARQILCFVSLILLSYKYIAIYVSCIKITFQLRNTLLPSYLYRLPQMAMCIQCTRGCCMDGMALGGGGCVQV